MQTLAYLVLLYNNLKIILYDYILFEWTVAVHVARAETLPCMTVFLFDIIQFEFINISLHAQLNYSLHIKHYN